MALRRVMRVAVGLSGGVDSCVAAALLKEAGYDVIGITMRLWQPGMFPEGLPGRSCFGACAEESVAAAQSFAEALGIPFHAFTCAEEYTRDVLAYFRETYLAGETPNPCIRCNAVMKFGLLPRLAREKGLVFDAFATGHYARLRRADDGRIMLLRGKDRQKDQSYFLYRLSQEQLAHLIFPLGEMTKADVRARALKAGWAAAKRPESQDFYSGSRDDLIVRPPEPGLTVREDGRVLGRHTGYWHFTVGQRKGLGLAGGEKEKLYVVRLDPARNEVILGPRAALVSTAFAVSDFNWISILPPQRPLACRVKIRSTGEPVGPATLEGSVCTVPGGLFGVAAGQSAVFYAADSDVVLGGGIIRKTP